jgi:hypothetical protein
MAMNSSKKLSLICGIVFVVGIVGFLTLGLVCRQVGHERLGTYGAYIQDLHENTGAIQSWFEGYITVENYFLFSGMSIGVSVTLFCWLFSLALDIKKEREGRL